MPQPDEYVEQVGDGWQIYYHYVDNKRATENKYYDYFGEIMKRRSLQITSAFYKNPKDQVLTIVNKAHITAKIIGDKSVIEKSGIYAALDEINNHFGDIKIEW